MQDHVAHHDQASDITGGPPRAFRPFFPTRSTRPPRYGAAGEGRHDRSWAGKAQAGQPVASAPTKPAAAPVGPAGTAESVGVGLGLGACRASRLCAAVAVPWPASTPEGQRHE